MKKLFFATLFGLFATQYTYSIEQHPFVKKQIKKNKKKENPFSYSVGTGLELFRYKRLDIDIKGIEDDFNTTGLSIFGKINYDLNEKFSTSTVPSFFYGAEDRDYIGVGNNLNAYRDIKRYGLIVSQIIEAKIPVFGILARPFLGLGLGYAKIKDNYLISDVVDGNKVNKDVNETMSGLLYEVSSGISFKTKNNFEPYIKFSIIRNNIDTSNKKETITSNNVSNTTEYVETLNGKNREFGGQSIQIGVGYNF